MGSTSVIGLGSALHFMLCGLVRINYSRGADGNTGHRDAEHQPRCVPPQPAGGPKARGRNSGGFTMLALLPVARITKSPFRSA